MQNTINLEKNNKKGKKRYHLDLIAYSDPFRTPIPIIFGQ